MVSSCNREASAALLEDSGATWSQGAYAGAAAEAEATSLASSTVGVYGSHGSKTDAAASRSGVGKSDENEGGGRKGVLPEASEAGYCGGGERWRASEVATLAGLSSASTSAVKHTRFVSATVSGGSAMPASSSTLRLLRGMGPEDERLEARESDNVTAEKGAWAANLLYTNSL